ncbi:Hypothetical protein PHPALM_12682 [Phytophthora palmivora]|uniref:Uncharacterized protein n=1 Tax=Phytophthora palmivora TaxID=4796 RepID=A0A2P4XZ51_9STRA|nr:Hypothetical protein PHPALM_12682 [Phytophthora palmivora]
MQITGWIRITNSGKTSWKYHSYDEALRNKVVSHVAVLDKSKLFKYNDEATLSFTNLLQLENYQ